ncbi:MAG: hypothetical protein SFX18_18185 [Pirellulales bacterium]|nr:hypothetical protein [Pirellulales bacterium]
MSATPSTRKFADALADVLGYLNFSAGNSDPKFLANLSALFAEIEAADPALPREAAPAGTSGGAYLVLHQALTSSLDELRADNLAFQDSTQVLAVLDLLFNRLLPAYLEHHRDLLFHQSAAGLFRPFFIGKAAEAILQAGAPWEETDRIIHHSLAKLNDYLGFRPVAVLHNRRKHEPYSHERCRPVPLYLAGVGVATGRYEALVRRALEILNKLQPGLLQMAWFDPELLSELAFDPRAYDFNHPANKRPNYHFGLWDPHVLDQQGFYRRFVLQQTLLEALLERVEAPGELSAAELLEEAAVVLAGTMLMAAGTSGNGPECHDSSVTLSNLLPVIANYRDDYYRQILSKLHGPHATRLQSELKAMRQPFAGARQHLNSQLARRRALQMQHVHLAVLFARLGYPEAALQQADIIPAVSARMTCRLYCLLTSGWHAARANQVSQAAEYLPQIENLLRRAIHCGAVVDPWNILGFGGQFSLFPAVENSVPDLRVDELIDLMEQVFALAARAWHLAAVADDAALCENISADFRRLAEWWDQYATTGIEGIKPVSGREAYDAAQRVAEALSAWHQAGAAAGNIGFWRGHAEQFDSPQAYARVIEALLEKHDLASAAGLMMHWLANAETLALEEGLFSFHHLARQWLAANLQTGKSGTPRAAQIPPGPAPLAAEKMITHLTSPPASAAAAPPGIAGQSSPAAKSAFSVARFFDQLEANSDSFWEAPELQFDGQPVKSAEDDIEDLFHPPEDDEEDENLYGAAYDEMIYRDSTADGIDSSLQEFGGTTDYELEAEANRINSRLAFLVTLARLWKQVALADPLRQPRWQLTADHLRAWLDHSKKNRRKLSALAHAIERQPLVPQSAEPEALVEYDRRRMIKESLLERVIATTVSMAEAELFLRAVLPPDVVGSAESEEPEHWGPTVLLWRALLAEDVPAARDAWPPFLAAIHKQSLLYVPLGKGGDPRRIAAARGLQQTLRGLLGRLPQLGLLRETCQLIQTARAMERDHPLGAGAVTEFDRLFEIGFKSLVTCLIDSADHWELRHHQDELADLQLIECLQQVTESLLSEWLSHSRTLRLSVLEKIASEAEWKEFVAFVEKYGHELFTQKFFNLGNLRAILHQGVEQWLEQLLERTAALTESPLDEKLAAALTKADNKRHLQLVIEAIVENYTEYRDYNATTTQSDRGEMVYMLLDFLRVKAGYERIHWNLRPVTMAHEVLVRAGRTGAAELWRRTMAERTSDAADAHAKKLSQLQKKYGMRLPTIADRLAERFVRPLDIDRIRALVKDAAEDARHNRASASFELLEQEAGELAGIPAGAGLDLPDWLAALEEEVDQVCGTDRQRDQEDPIATATLVYLSWDDIQAQLSNWETKFLEDKGRE